MSRVFVVQRTLYRDRETGELRERFGIETAARYGELIDLLGSSASPFNPDPVLKEMHEKLQDFNDDDFLLCIGNPILIGWATAIAADYNDGRVWSLQWHGKGQKYIPVRADIYEHSIPSEEEAEG
jgi:hypothetical protein